MANTPGELLQNPGVNVRGGRGGPLQRPSAPVPNDQHSSREGEELRQAGPRWGARMWLRPVQGLTDKKTRRGGGPRGLA